MPFTSRRRFSLAAQLPLAALLTLFTACADDRSVDDLEQRQSALKASHHIGLIASDDNAKRRQIADIVDVGGEGKFVVGYATFWGDLMYTRRTIDGEDDGNGWILAGSNTWWVRANTSRTIARPNYLCTARTRGTLYTNFFAAQINSENVQGGNGEVVLDAHSICGPSWTTSFGRVSVDTGSRRPSVASKNLEVGTRILIVYGKDTQLRGRWCTRAPWTSGVCDLSSSFVIDPNLGGHLFSSDVIYNAHSDTFIIGYIGELTGQVKNIVIAADGNVPPTVVRGATLFGNTDTFPDGHGHHTSVAYNPNGDGTYVWWRQNTATTKAIYTHDQMGNLTSFAPWTTYIPGESHAGISSYTCPVDQTRDLETRYLAAIPFVDAQTGSIYFIGGDAQTAGTHEGWTGVDVVDSSAPPIRQLAVRGLYNTSLNRVQSVALGASEAAAGFHELYVFATDQPD